MNKFLISMLALASISGAAMAGQRDFGSNNYDIGATPTDFSARASSGPSRIVERFQASGLFTVGKVSADRQRMIEKKGFKDLSLN